MDVRVVSHRHVTFLFWSGLLKHDLKAGEIKWMIMADLWLVWQKNWRRTKLRWPIDDISDVPRFFRKKHEPLFFPTVISSGNVYSKVITSRNLFPTVITSGNVFPTVITSGNMFPTVTSGGNVFSTAIRSGNLLPTVISDWNVFSTVITNGNAFRQL